MNEKMKHAVLRVSAGCGAVLWLVAGCASVEHGSSAGPQVPSPAGGTNVAVKAEAANPLVPEGGYAWDDLARLAATNSSEAKVMLLEAEAERHRSLLRRPLRLEWRRRQHWRVLVRVDATLAALASGAVVNLHSAPQQQLAQWPHDRHTFR